MDKCSAGAGGTDTGPEVACDEPGGTGNGPEGIPKERRERNCAGEGVNDAGAAGKMPEIGGKDCGGTAGEGGTLKAVAPPSSCSYCQP